MAGRLTFELKGGKELDATLKELGPKIARNLGTKAVREGAKPIVKEAKRLAPRRTGTLAKSITAVSQKSANAEELLVLIGFRPPISRRAHFVEYGTSRHPAQPFMRPAMDARAADALKAMQEVLATGILREEWKQTISYLAEGGEIDFGDG